MSEYYTDAKKKVFDSNVGTKTNLYPRSNKSTARESYIFWKLWARAYVQL